MLKFHAKPGQMCPWPNQSLFVGQPRQYVGRDYQAGDIEKREPARYPASKQPSEVKEGTQDAADLIRQCRKGAIWPADEHTAGACGVEFAAVEQGEEGEWFAKKTVAPAPKATAKKD